MLAQIIFPDGSLISAPSWEELEKELRADKWNPSNSEKFRAEMANRAKNWSGKVVDVELISKQFIEQLESAGLLMIVREEG